MKRRQWIKSVLFAAIAASLLPACIIGSPEHIATVVAKDNSSLLDALRQEHRITTIMRNLNGEEKTYAITIDDVSEDSNLYWLFYVDGELVEDMAIDEIFVQKGQTVSAYFLPLDKNTN